MSKNSITALKFHPSKNIFATLGIDETLMIVNVDLDSVEKYVSGRKDAQKVRAAQQFDVSRCDQLALRGISDETVISARALAHWLSFGPALMLAALPAAALLRLSGQTLLRLELGLGIATPGLAALAVMVASLTAGLRRAGALAGLLMLPLAIPLLIFGAGALDPASGSSGFKLLAAVSLLLCALTPFAGGAALRALRE